MLTPAQLDIVKSTVPLLETGGETLARHFYQIMLGGYPEVRVLFNQANQASGAQPRALALSVLAYARHIDDLGALAPAVARIVNKHVALQIQPRHYPIVGKCLLQAILDVLGPDVATPAVLDAWGAAYGQLADILIGQEKAAYDALAAAPGGWRGARTFRVVRKEPESTEITSFYLEPSDGGQVLAYEPGQYIGLHLAFDGQDLRRNYSISSAPDNHHIRISVKREPSGVASNYLHDRVSPGSELELFPPAGEFILDREQRPLVLISGGVGITPVLAMAQAELARSQRPIHFIHYARDSKVRAFASTLRRWAKDSPHFRLHQVLGQVEALESFPPDAIGRPTREQFNQWLPADRNVSAYFVGPKPFMALVSRVLHEIGVPDDQARHEFFGPTQLLA